MLIFVISMKDAIGETSLLETQYDQGLGFDPISVKTYWGVAENLGRILHGDHDELAHELSHA